jgi:MFS family permease
MMKKFENIGLMLGIFLISISILAFELLQTRILSFIYWNHIVYITVTIALLGFGISGAFLSIFPRRILTKIADYLVFFSLGYSFFLVLCVYLSAKLVPLSQYLNTLTKLIISYNLLIVPFFFAGLIISAALSKFTQQINRLYFINLAGSGIGSLLFVFAIEPFGAPLLVLILAIMGVIAGFFFSMNARKGLKIIAFLSIIVLTGLAPFSNHIMSFYPEKYKHLWKSLDMKSHPDAKIEYTKWTPISRIDVSSDEKNHLVWYLPQFNPKDYKVISADGDAFTLTFSPRYFNTLIDAVETGKDTLFFNSVYLIKKNPEVLIIGMGGGIDVMSALAFNARNITAIELNKAVYNITTKKYHWFNKLNFEQERLTAHNDEGRSFVRRSESSYDIIQITLIDTFAALSTGAYVLSENYLYTVESLSDYFQHLKEDGILSVTRWLLHPTRESLRLNSVALYAYQQLGINEPEKHVLIIGNGILDCSTALFKKSPFTEEEIKNIMNYSEKYSNPIIFFPKIYPPQEQMRFEEMYYSQYKNKALSEVKNTFNKLFTSWDQGKIDAFYNTYRYNVRPVYDDKPFFFEYNRVTDLWKLEEVDIRGNWPLFTLYFLLIISFLTVILLIFLPLYIFKRKGLKTPRASATSFYFISLGIGFMFIEIGLMQKLVLFLGHPIYSIAVVLSSLLIFSGIGSYASGRLHWKKEKIIFLSVLIITGILLIYAGTIDPLVNYFLKANKISRVFLSIALLAPLSFFMGMPFPSGLKKIEKVHPGFIPWAWGINGGSSVLASILCIIIAMWFGFLSTILIAAVVYLAGTLIFLIPWQKGAIT